MDISHLATLAISETGFIFDPRTGHSYSANTTALELLKGLKQGLSATQLNESLKTGFDCQSDISTDIEAFFQALANYGLLDASRSGRSA